MSPEIPMQRQEAQELLEELNDRRWDLLEELQRVELGRTACFAVLRKKDE